MHLCYFFFFFSPHLYIKHSTNLPINQFIELSINISRYTSINAFIFIHRLGGQVQVQQVRCVWVGAEPRRSLRPLPQHHQREDLRGPLVLVSLIFNR